MSISFRNRHFRISQVILERVRGFQFQMVGKEYEIAEVRDRRGQLNNYYPVESKRNLSKPFLLSIAIQVKMNNS